MDRLIDDYQKNVQIEKEADEKIQKLNDIFKQYEYYLNEKRYHDISKELKGIKKAKYDKKNSVSLEAYQVYREGLINVAKRLYEDGKITPNRWKHDLDKAKKDKKKSIEDKPEIYDMAIIETLLYNRELVRTNKEPEQIKEQYQERMFEKQEKKHSRNDMSL